MSKPKQIKSKGGRKLGAQAQTFIREVAETGDATAAITKAGYKSKNPADMGRSYRHRYRAEIHQAMIDRIENDQPVALSNIKAIAEDKETPAGVRLKANQDILDRGNLLRGERLPAEKQERSTDELISAMVDGMGVAATALALANLNIPVPEYITAQLHAEQVGPASKSGGIPTIPHKQDEMDSLPN